MYLQFLCNLLLHPLCITNSTKTNLTYTIDSAKIFKENIKKKINIFVNKF